MTSSYPRLLLWGVTLLLAIGCAKPSERMVEDWVSATVDASQAELRQGAYAAADHRLQAALAQADRQLTPPQRLRLQVQRGQVLSQQAFYAQGGAEEAKAVLSRARAEAAALQEPALEATALDADGFVDFGKKLFAEQGSYPEVRKTFLQALQLREKVGEPSAIAESLFHVGLTFEQNQQAGEAKPYYERSLALAQQAKNNEIASYPMRHLAGLREEARDLDAALEMHRRCLAMRVQAGAVRLVPFALTAIGDILLKKKDPSAREVFLQAREIALTQGNKLALAQAEEGLKEAASR